MTKRFRRFAASAAACAVALMQLTAAMPAVHAEYMWDKDWRGNWFNPIFSEPEEEETTEAETMTAAVTTTTTAATTTTAPTTMSPHDFFELFFGKKTTEQTTVTTETTTALTTPTTSAATVSTTAATILTTESTTARHGPVPPGPHTLPPLPTAEPVTTTASTTTTTTTTAMTTAATAASTAESSSTKFTMPNSETKTIELRQEMPDFSYLGAVGTLSEEQTRFIAEEVYKCCVNPFAYPQEEVNGMTTGRRFINLEVDGLEFIAADPEHYEENRMAVAGVVDTVLHNYKECLLANQSFGYNFHVGPNKVRRNFYGIYLSFKVPDEMYKVKYADIMQKFSEIYSQADPAWTDVEKALFFHDYISIHCNYDYDSVTHAADGNDSHYAFGLLNNHYGVCQGIAQLYNMLLNECGIESWFVIGHVINPEYDPDFPDDPDCPKYLSGHAWNLVRIGDEYFHVDITSDDTGKHRQPSSPDVNGEYLGYAGRVGHEAFMVSSEDLSQVSEFFEESALNPDWATSINEDAFAMADSENMSIGFWRNADGAVLPYNGGWLLKQGTKRAEYHVYTWDEESQEFLRTMTPLFVDDSKWKWRDNFGAKPEKEKIHDLPQNYSTFCVYGDIAIFTVDEGKALHYAYPRDKSNMTATMAERELLRGVEYEMNDVYYIYGLTIEDDTLKLFTAKSPDIWPTVVSIPMDVVRARMDMTTSETLPEPETKPAASLVAGDFSGDGSLDVVDAVSMTHYLLGNKALPDADTRQRMDLVPDGVIDAYDLAKLKWLLLHQK